MTAPIVLHGSRLQHRPEDTAEKLDVADILSNARGAGLSVPGQLWTRAEESRPYISPHVRLIAQRIRARAARRIIRRGPLAARSASDGLPFSLSARKFASGVIRPERPSHD